MNTGSNNSQFLFLTDTESVSINLINESDHATKGTNQQGAKSIT